MLLNFQRLLVPNVMPRDKTRKGECWLNLPAYCPPEFQLSRYGHFVTHIPSLHNPDCFSIRDATSLFLPLSTRQLFPPDCLRQILSEAIRGGHYPPSCSKSTSESTSPFALAPCSHQTLSPPRLPTRHTARSVSGGFWITPSSQTKQPPSTLPRLCGLRSFPKNHGTFAQGGPTRGEQSTGNWRPVSWQRWTAKSRSTTKSTGPGFW